MTGNAGVQPAPETIRDYEPHPLTERQEQAGMYSDDGDVAAYPAPSATPDRYGATGGPQSLIEVEPLND